MEIMNNWKNELYTHGFLLTNDNNILNLNIDIEWDTWKKEKVGNYIVYAHKNSSVHVFRQGQMELLLIGHAYNPFTMENNELSILENLCNLYKKDGYWDYLDQITGMFFIAVICNGTVSAVSDCAGMLGSYYAKVDDKVYFSSYSQLIADICRFEEDDYVKKLKKSRLFHLYGWFLPGDLSPYKEIKRIIPNTELVYDSSFKINRFYPRNKYEICDSEDYCSTVRKVGKILHNSMSLISDKWENPAISLTGGTDSQTTLACTSDLQRKFNYFSYISLPREETDANAAHKICEHKGLNHDIFRIETNKSVLKDFDEVDRLVERHYAYLGKGNENDICKRIGLKKVIHFDVEVKSWVSEVARASRYKMYSKKRFPKKVSARRLTTMYKVFLFNRVTALKTDKKFKQYLENTNLAYLIDKYDYPWTEFFVWEIVFGCWGSLALTGEHRLTNDITIPYNNRALLDMMIRTPLEKRLTDQLNKDIIKTMDPDLYNLNIHVINGNETTLREIAERIYYDVHSHLPW